VNSNARSGDDTMQLELELLHARNARAAVAHFAAA
jgi:hypothetical protein